MILTPACIDQYLEWLSAHGGSPNTIRAYRSDLMALAATMPGSDLETAAAQWLTDNRATWAPKTTQRKLTALRSWAKWAGLPSFLSAYRPPTPARQEPHPIPEGISGVLKMVATTTRRDRRALVALCGLVGLRVSEACQVAPEHIDAAQRTLTVRGKGDKTRVVPLSAAAWEAIEPAYVKASQFGGTLVGVGQRQARDLVTRIAAKAELSRAVSSHDLRATFATAAYNKSLDLRAVQELLGHSSVETTRVYTGVTQESMRAAAEVA